MRSFQTKLRSQCNKVIRDLAIEGAKDPDSFRECAAAAARQLGPDSVRTLKSLFHSEHSPPDEARDLFPGLGQWIAARQFAIFEVFYNLPDASLETLKEVAFGNYDWTQGNAIEVLLRLAADGFRTAEILEDVRRNFADVQYEAQLYAVEPLLKLAQSNPQVANVLRHLEDIDEFNSAVNDLQGS